MIYHKILIPLFISLLIAACDTQQPPAPVEKNTQTQTVPQKTVPEESRPALDLSIDNIAIEPQQNSDELFLEEKEAAEENSELFETLSNGKAEPKIDVSGKLLTDEEKIDITDPLESVEGVQINIEGKFE
ncbi:hypothetical protein ACFL3P_03835 [Pseudomonadota bacterium]